jgi:diguanylate cyclase (GGDEF)-like protein
MAMPGIANFLALDAFMAILLAIIAFRLFSTVETMDPPLKVFIAMLCLTAAMLAVDALCWIVNGVPGLAAYNVAANMAYFLIQPTVPFLWILYCLVKTPNGKTKIRWLSLILGSPLLVNAALVALVPATGWLLSVDAGGWYHRGPAFPVSAAISFFHLCTGIVIVLSRGKDLTSPVKGALLSFAILPFLGGAGQSLFYGLAIIWPSVSISLLLIYLSVENDMLAVDYLTGLQNRRSLDRYLEKRMRDSGSGAAFGALMIDIDDFKRINDSWGHSEGDKALQELARIMRACFHHRDFIARYAGDEFVAVLDLRAEGALEASRRRFISMVEESNAGAAREWRLSVSVGGSLYRPGSGARDSDRFLGEIDALMYRAKGERGKNADTAQSG